MSGLRPALTSFVGRREGLARLRALLSASRLITITGAGGAGKTRLAEEFAASLARSFPEAIAVAYLADARAPADVVEAVAAGVGLRQLGSRPVRAELIDYLGPRRLLLLLDNTEHVAAPAAELAAELLRTCPGLVILATGRGPLYVPGEQLFPIGGLLPERAVELFVDRARLVAPDFALDPTSGPLARDICERLDGMPLAIELAAAQVGRLGLATLDQRLAGHLPELATRSTVGPERQRTLSLTLTWSHNLLSEEQRALWRGLSVFSGGFTLDAAEAVAEPPPVTSASTADLLGDLVDQSLVVYDPAAGRYRLLEVVREYAGDRLREAGEMSTIAGRHRAWMVGLADAVDSRWFGPDQPALADRLEAEAGNLRAALERCEAAGAYADGLRLANAGFWYWLTRASLEEGVRWYRRLVGRSDELALEARAHWRAGYLSTIRLDFPAAHEFLDAALDLAVQADDVLDVAYAQGLGGLLLLYEQPARAPEARRRCQLLVEAPGGDTMARQWGLIGYALASFALDDLEECQRACRDGIEIGRQTGDVWGRELSLRFLGMAEWRSGHPDAAEAALLECARLDRQLGDLWHTGWATEALGWIAVDTGRLERGARLLGIAAGVWARTDLSLGYPYRAWHDRAVAALRTRLGPRRLEAELALGQALRRDDALAFVLSEAAPARGPGPSPLSLSERELEVAALVADGLGNREIGEKLFLSPRTVEKHVEHVMDKLGVGSRAEIAAWHARVRGATDAERNT